MDEMIKLWLNNINTNLRKVYDDEISEVEYTIKNEHIAELGYNGIDENPHTHNIERYKEYIDILKELRDKIIDN